MKKLKLDPEEQSVLAAFEQGHLKPLPNSKQEVVRIAKIFKSAGKKNSNVAWA
jgi:hypothetical protein